MSLIINEVSDAVLEKGVHYLTSDYKDRNKDREHKGIDLIGKGKSIDNVIAIASGKVITSKYSKTAGNYVEIEHANKYITRYLHMKDNSLKVKKGDYVTKGEILGTMGNTGNSRGAHLHFAVLNPKLVPVDPLPYLLGEKDFGENEEDYFKSFVKNVQKIIGVKVDGIPGPNTLNKTITISSKTNNKHPLVLVLQNYLLYLGYDEVGIPDGIAGSRFTKAVKRFQLENACVSDGVITKKQKTWQKLLKLK